MKRLRKQHVLEQSIYGAIWIVIFLLPLIGGYFAMSGGLEREETRMVIRESWLSILPFFVLFLLNNYGLVPYFLFKKRYWQYTVSLIFVIGMICWLSPFSFANHSPKDFKRGELPLRMKENRRDQIIKMREKAREEGDVHWYESNPKISKTDSFSLSSFCAPLSYSFHHCLFDGRVQYRHQTFL